MENNNNDIDKLFKDHLDGHQAAYVPGAWEKMEVMLDADEGTVWLHNTQRFVLASVAGAILLAGSVMAYISGGPSEGAFVQSDAANDKNVATHQEKNVNSASGKASDAGTIRLDDVIAENSADGRNAADNKQPAATKPAAPVVDVSSTDIKKKAPVQQPEAALAESPAPVGLDNEEETEMAETTAPVIAEVPRLPLALLAGLNPLKSMRVTGDNAQMENLELNISLLDSAQKARKAVQEMKQFYGWQLGLYAGFNFNKTISTADTKFNAGAGFLGGLSLSKNWSRHWGFAADINYLRRTGNTITRTVEQTRYFFEKTTTSYFFVTKTMDVLQMPISIHYNLTRKHKFSLGAMA
ncbi:MAG TPA: porin family protein, partial [Bacteroidia bacterium]|nr:porin family protein [Bacteroidia bacterium]